ncbi:ATP-binding cassette domain-containing protein [Leucobacter sp. CSA2]|uniref:ATP-binding cassette domain-containing protein n=1 Tax=Leucobacter edaphi TaxID=2796472 RepID=A0A934UXU4_9MICO|nr:ATP-binding cassette domain-containing protein [Leucobacter edaphi]MBK0422450.1 ATP-binding cassette domain-containing protein [Leucobacter edaphi]
MPDSSRHPSIEYDGFSKHFGRIRAVEGITFSVAPGPIVGFLGPNGAGKTTALRGILGLLRPTRGSATALGKPLEAPENRGLVVGAHLDGIGFETGITASRHLKIACLALGQPRSRVDEVLREVDLAALARRRVKTFSTGMVQRLGLATALLGSRPIFVVDEPGNGLDPEDLRWLKQNLRTFADEGGTVLVSSHQLADFSSIVDELVIMKRTVLYAGTHESLVGADNATLEEKYFELTDPFAAQ